MFFIFAYENLLDFLVSQLYRGADLGWVYLMAFIWQERLLIFIGDIFLLVVFLYKTVFFNGEIYEIFDGIIIFISVYFILWFGRSRRELYKHYWQWSETVLLCQARPKDSLYKH